MLLGAFFVAPLLLLFMAAIVGAGLGAGMLGATLGFLLAMEAAAAAEIMAVNVAGGFSSIVDIGLGVGCVGGFNKAPAASLVLAGATDGIAAFCGAWSGLN